MSWLVGNLMRAWHYARAATHYRVARRRLALGDRAKARGDALST